MFHKGNLHNIHRHLLPFYFPILLFSLLFLLTIFKISGSSLGFYGQYFYEDGSQSRVNDYKQIRADEWMVNTQLAIAQKQAGYPLINKDIGDGQNMSLIIDVPYKEWSIAFKPHNIAFLIMPFDYAFAFKWWFFAVALALSVYTFSLRILKRKYLLASLISIVALCSPFLFWWYQYITLAPLYYGFFIISCILYIFSTKNKLRLILALFGLVYLLAAFALIMYPAFQIGIVLAIVVLFICYVLGSYVSAKNLVQKKDILRKTAMVAGCGVMALLIAGVFVLTRKDAVDATLNTVYPGNRTSVAGDMNPLFIWSNNLSGLVTDQEYATNSSFVKPANQSEISNSSLPFMVITLLTFYTTHLLAKQRRREKKLFAIFIGLSMLFVIMLAKLFVPLFTYVQNIFLLNGVPTQRLILMYSFVSIVTLVCMTSYYSGTKQQIAITRNKTPLLIALITLAVYTLLAAIVLVGNYDAALSQEIIGYGLMGGAAIALFVYLFLTRQYVFALTVLAGLSFCSVAGIMPLYTGKTVNVTETPLSKEMQKISSSDPDGGWVVSDITELNLYPAANGARAITGLYTYPQKAFWAKATHVDGQTFNRYAHVRYIAVLNEPLNVDIQRQPDGAPINDSVLIQGDVCNKLFKKLGVKYLISYNPAAINPQCTQLLSSVPFKKSTAYIYKINL